MPQLDIPQQVTGAHRSRAPIGLPQVAFPQQVAAAVAPEAAPCPMQLGPDLLQLGGLLVSPARASSTFEPAEGGAPDDGEAHSARGSARHRGDGAERPRRPAGGAPRRQAEDRRQQDHRLRQPDGHRAPRGPSRQRREHTVRRRPCARPPGRRDDPAQPIAAVRARGDAAADGVRARLAAGGREPGQRPDHQAGVWQQAGAWA